MASSYALQLPPNVWTLATSSNAASVKFQNVGRCRIRARYTNGTTAPTGYEGDEYDYSSRTGKQGEPLTALTDLSTVSGANRLWLMAMGQDGLANVEWA